MSREPAALCREVDKIWPVFGVPYVRGCFVETLALVYMGKHIYKFKPPHTEARSASFLLPVGAYTKAYTWGSGFRDTVLPQRRRKSGKQYAK